MEVQNMFYVYEWFIEDTGEIIYVGKGTGKRYKVRTHNRFFNDMIKRYKCSSRIVKEFENEDDAFQYEYERSLALIAIGQCVCNIDLGGMGGKQSWWTDEMRKKYSENNVMKSEKQRKRMSVNNPMKNKETAQKVADALGKKICVEDKVYKSLKDVSETYNVSSQLFLYWLERGYTNKYERCYYYGEKPKELIIRDHRCSKKKIPVIVDGVRYEHIHAAAKAINCSSSYLSRSLKKNKSLVKGHICQYGNQQPNRENTDNSITGGSTTNG
jgi:hypothetical protein